MVDCGDCEFIDRTRARKTTKRVGTRFNAIEVRTGKQTSRTFGETRV